MFFAIVEQGLMRAAGHLLKHEGFLYMYGVSKLLAALCSIPRY